MKKIDVLDHGFVRLVESWGAGDSGEPESGIIEAARQSTQGSFRGWEKDEKLLRYLYSHNHATPFEFCGMVVEVRAPIFVFREWHRHRTQSYNEMSARYSPLPSLNYIPSIERIMMSNDKNKQAGSVKGASGITFEMAELFRVMLTYQYNEFEESYQDALETGVPKELARCGMPVGRYSQMRASANLRNWIGFLTLRMHPDAQWEIRQFAKAVGEIIKDKFPRTWKLFNDKVEVEND